LEAGDHLDQQTFHARYLAMPKGTRAELIGGVVFMPSPAKRRHSRMHFRVISWAEAYEEATPGVEGFDNVSNILGEESEPQPDVALTIAPDKGGQTRDVDDWMVGPPELNIEVAVSSESYDLHEKLRDYEKAGVKEYLVIVLRHKRVLWYFARKRRFVLKEPGADGILRSDVFPGLWLDPAALLRGDMKRVRTVLAQGLATPEHAAFVAKLAAK
jgi:Uma2 family endonuclease